MSDYSEQVLEQVNRDADEIHVVLDQALLLDVPSRRQLEIWENTLRKAAIVLRSQQEKLEDCQQVRKDYYDEIRRLDKENERLKNQKKRLMAELLNYAEWDWHSAPLDSSAELLEDIEGEDDG